MKLKSFVLLLLLLVAVQPASSADWLQFRGPGGLGISAEKNLPTKWSDTENILWRKPLPGAGGSSPILLGNRLFLTCYSGYGMKAGKGNMKELKRHLLCLDRRNGDQIWRRDFDPVLPEHKYQGEGAYHGYSSTTPITDGKRLYVFMGKSGVYCFDLDGKDIWHQLVGSGTNRWGCGCSPVLYKDMVIINASVESGSMIALSKKTGKEIWRSKGIHSSWNTPLLYRVGGGMELAVSIQSNLIGLNPDTGKELWRADGVHRYVCPSVVAHAGIVYCIGGGHTSLAVRGGGSGTVTKSHGVWREKKGSNVVSPIYHKGHLYWATDHGGVFYCQNAKTGKTIYAKRMSPATGIIYGSPVLADGKIYYLSQGNGTYVLPAEPKFKLLSHNVIKSDKSRTNSSIAVSNKQLFLRTDKFIYCIGK